MFKRLLFASLGLVSFSWAIAAPADVSLQTDDQTPEELRLTGSPDVGPVLALNRPDIFRNVDGELLIHGLPVLTLLDGRRFPISGELARAGMLPANLFPTAFLTAVDVQKNSNPRYGSDAPGGIVDLHLNRGYTTGGEVGVFYGHSSGKYGGTDIQEYLTGTIATDKVSITVGVAHEDSTSHYARGRDGYWLAR